MIVTIKTLQQKQISIDIEPVQTVGLNFLGHLLISLDSGIEGQDLPDS